METLDFSFGSFALTFTDGDHVWYFAVHPEMYPVREGISPSCNYFIYCTHPTRGSCSYLIEQDENCFWYSKAADPFITKEIIDWLGTNIERRSR